MRVDLEPRVLPGANFAQAYAAKLRCPANCFEVVISNHSLEHFENLEASLEQIWRVVKRIGRLYVGVPVLSVVKMIRLTAHIPKALRQEIPVASKKCL